MACKGRCYDRTPAESLFHMVEVERVHRDRFEIREHARRTLFTDIEGYRDRRRIHAAPGCLTPGQADRRAAGTP